VSSVLLVGVLLLAGACGDGGSAPAPGRIELVGVVVGSPACPETVTTSSECAPAPLEGRVLVVRDAAGHEVGRARSDERGRFHLALAPGHYRVEPQPGAGSPAAPSPIDVVVPDDGSQAPELRVVYDTGIR
jgi:hypothetical protein